MKVKSLSHNQLFVTPWTVAYQASPSMGFSRQEYQSGLPFPSPGDLPDPGIEPKSLALAGRFFTATPPRKPVPGHLAHMEDVIATKGALESPLVCLPLKISLEGEPLDLPFLEDKNN